MARTRVTISDLARNLQLSTCTVSKILNKSFNGFSYSPETIARVEEAAERLGYRANAQARALRTKKSGLIGFVLPSARLSFFGDLTDALEFRLRERGYQLLLGHSRDSQADEVQLLSTFHSRDVEGLLWVPLKERVRFSDHHIPENFPLVLLDRPTSTKGASHVTTDDRASSRLLAERIKAAGHRRIAVVNAPKDDRSLRERFAGMEDVFGTKIVSCEVENSAESARASVTQLLQKSLAFTALVALSEPLAIGALAAIRDREMDIPRELSFASFDDFPLAAHWAPRITLMRQDVDTLAQSAVEKILSLMEAKTPRVTNAKIPALLEWRESVAEVPAKG